jgi:hypothetical protein
VEYDGTWHLPYMEYKPQTKGTSALHSATSAPLRFNFSLETKRGGAEDAEKDAEWKIVGPSFPTWLDDIPTSIQ